MALAILFAGRGVFNLVFGLVLLTRLREDSPPGFGPGGFYALVDGALILALAVALFRSRDRWLFPAVLADALPRLGVGVFIFANPRMHEPFSGGTAFLLAAIVMFMTLGLAGIVFVLVNKPTGDAARRTMVRPALASSLCTLLLGVALDLGMLAGEQRAALGCYAMAAGLVLAHAGYRLGRPAAQPHVPPGPDDPRH